MYCDHFVRPEKSPEKLLFPGKKKNFKIFPGQQTKDSTILTGYHYLMASR